MREKERNHFMSLGCSFDLCVFSPNEKSYQECLVPEWLEPFQWPSCCLWLQGTRGLVGGDISTSVPPHPQARSSGLVSMQRSSRPCDTREEFASPQRKYEQAFCFGPLFIPFPLSSFSPFSAWANSVTGDEKNTLVNVIHGGRCHTWRPLDVIFVFCLLDRCKDMFITFASTFCQDWVHWDSWTQPWVHSRCWAE